MGLTGYNLFQREYIAECIRKEKEAASVASDVTQTDDGGRSAAPGDAIVPIPGEQIIKPDKPSIKNLCLQYNVPGAWKEVSEENKLQYSKRARNEIQASKLEFIEDMKARY